MLKDISVSALCALASSNAKQTLTTTLKTCIIFLNKERFTDEAVKRGRQRRPRRLFRLRRKRRIADALRPQSPAHTKKNKKAEKKEGCL
jgi:hypothetical protein